MMTNQNPHRENPAFVRVTESIMLGMAEALEQIWQRADAVKIVDQFMDGKLVFQVDHHGITLAVTSADEPTSAADRESEPPVPGNYL
ncbi:hypothetical protein [Microbispora bryophytorum]|uniref:hypothetical protein n=1 Tax=Microbispora bryophytorum TaxID=1460882 RepID=UPI0033FD8953